MPELERHGACREGVGEKRNPAERHKECRGRARSSEKKVFQKAQSDPQGQHHRLRSQGNVPKGVCSFTLNQQ